METLLQVVVPALVVFTTLFGLLGRSKGEKVGGVALFGRVGAVGLVLGGLAYYLTYKTNLLDATPAFVKRAYLGLLVGGALLVAFAALGQALKQKR